MTEIKVSNEVVNNHIDSKNKELYDYICAKVNLECLIGDDVSYGVCTSRDTNIAKIYFKQNTISPESFTHELLHVNLYINKLDIMNELYNVNFTEDDMCLSDIFRRIGNVLEHKKMIGKFVTLGYQAKYFVLDNDKSAIKENQISELIMMKLHGYRGCEYFTSLVLGYFFSKCSCNNLYDYSEEHRVMEFLEPELCQIMDKLLKSWGEEKIPISEMANSFYSDIKKWKSKFGIHFSN